MADKLPKADTKDAQPKTLLEQLNEYRWALVIVGIAAFLPLLWSLVRLGITMPHPVLRVSPQWEILGSWLSGILTPASLFLAFWGIANQNRVASEQMKEIRRENDLKERALFADNYEKIYDALNQQAEEIIRRAGITPTESWKEVKGVRKLVRILNGEKWDEGGVVSLHRDSAKDRIYGQPEFKKFSVNVRTLTATAEQHGVTAMLDDSICDAFELTRGFSPAP